MKIEILGIGAIGGYIAASLSFLDDLEIYLFARSNYNTIKNNGITLTEIDGSEISLRNFSVENSMGKIPKCDIIFVCVQSGQTGGLLKDLPSLCHEHSKELSYRMKTELPQNAGNLITFFADKNIELNQLKKEYSDIFKDITEC